MKLIFATGNLHKLREVEAAIGGGVELSTPREHGITGDIPEDSDTLDGNARQKARYIHERTGMDCFADDTGLEVDALDGAPGVYSARYAGPGHDHEANMALLLKNMEGKSDRAARFRTSICLILDGKEYIFEGKVEGAILLERQGGEGFGYDPIFMPDGYDMSFAEMSLEDKNAISHRGRAVRKLAEFLRGRE